MSTLTSDTVFTPSSSPRISSRPDGTPLKPTAPAGPFGREITAIGILTALRRCWAPALAIAIPAALLATAVMWELVPATYESTAILKIEQYENRLAFQEGPTKETDFNTYRESQKNYLLSRPIMLAALRDSAISGCRTLRDVAHPVDWLLTKMKSDNQIGAEFLKISLEGEYPQDLALILNGVKDAYLNQTVYMERNKKIEELRLLEEQFEDVDHKVTAAQDHIDRLAESLGTGDAEVAVVKQELITEEIAQSQRALRELNSQIRAEEAARSALLRQGLTPAQVGAGGLSGLTGGVFGPPGLNGAPAAGVTPGTTNAGLTLQQELMYVQQQIARFESQLRDPNHRDVRRLKERESTLRAMLSGSADPTGTVVPLSRLEWLQQQKSALEVDLERQTQHLETLNKGMIELEKEKRKIEQDITLRDTLQEQKYQRRIELDAPNRITVVQDANIPEQPQMKKKVQLSLLSGLATLGCIVCGFTLFEWFSHRVGAASDISGQVGLRVIGTIPSPDRGGLLGLGLFAGKVDHDEWNRAVTESMDVVRTFLMRHIDPARPASVLITSASANEGKTTLSCQLAASLARTGKRVALVDCDFRRPSAHELLGGAPGPGLSEWLRGEASFDEIRQATQADGLTFIPAGRVDQRVLQLLSIDGGRSLIQQLKSRFDFVIIDTSPLLFVAEPSMIAQNADIVLLATRKDYSRVPYVLQARDSLRSLQVPLLGSIMVGADSDFQRQTYGYQQEVVRMTSGT